MSTHSRLALVGAASVLALAVPVALTIGYYFDRTNAVGFLYGGGVGAAGFASIAVPVSLMTVRPTGPKVVLGAAVYAGRLVFAAVAIGVPIFAGVWPALPLLAGVAGAYVVENVLLLAMAPRKMSGATAVGPARGGVERRTGG